MSPAAAPSCATTAVPMIFSNPDDTVTRRDPSEETKCHVCPVNIMLQCEKEQELKTGQTDILTANTPIQLMCIKGWTNDSGTWKCRK